MNKPIDNRNMALWERLFPTPPSQTKSFKRAGGFSGTAIKPYWCIQRMTEEFGPHGQGWGHKVLETATYSANDGQMCFVVLVNVWYVKQEQSDIHKEPERCETGPQFGQTMMIVKRASGEMFFDEEAPKKAVTDGIVKCMSYLGLGGDVHLGMFDDSKYVAEQRIDERKEKEREEAEERKAKKAARKSAEAEDADRLEEAEKKKVEEKKAGNGAHLDHLDEPAAEAPPAKFNAESWRDKVCAELKLLKTEKAVRTVWATSIKPTIEKMLWEENEAWQKIAIYVHKQVKERLAEVRGE